MRWGLVHTWKAFMTFTVTQSQGGKAGIACGPSQTQTTINGVVSKLDDLDLHVTINGTTKRWSVGSECNGDYAQVLNPPEIDLEKGTDTDGPQLQLLGQLTLYETSTIPEATKYIESETLDSNLEINSDPIRETLKPISDMVRVRGLSFGRDKLIPSVLSWTDSEANSGVRPETVEYWRRLFDMFDPEGFGEIPWPDFNLVLKSKQFAEAMEPGKLQILEDVAKVDSRNSSAITFQHFVNIGVILMYYSTGLDQLVCQKNKMKPDFFNFDPDLTMKEGSDRLVDTRCPILLSPELPKAVLMSALASQGHLLPGASKICQLTKILDT